MKNILFILMLSIILISCGKEEINEVDVFKPCNDIVYLTLNGEYYQVCNFEELQGIESGTVLKLAYKEIDECKNVSFEPCITLLPIPESKSWVKILYQL